MDRSDNEHSIPSISTSPSSDLFSYFTKNVVTEGNDNKCWHCSKALAEAVAVIAKTDPLLDFFREEGLINFNLFSRHNAIPLCQSCKVDFELSADPALVIMPADLQFFIDFEKRDRQMRKFSNRLRIVPTTEQYKQAGGLYIAIDVKKYRIWEPKAWAGAPLAMLRRCFSLLGNPRSALIEERGKLQELYNLYFGRVKEDDNEDNKGESNHDAESGISLPKKRKRSHNKGSAYSGPLREMTITELIETGKFQGMPAPNASGKSWCWDFGPEFSTAELVHRFAALGFPREKANPSSGQS